MSGPIFGRPPISRNTLYSSTNERERTSKSPKNATNQYENSSIDSSVRLVQLEIGQKEACNIIRKLYLEVSSSFKIEQQSIEFEDLLTGIFLLGNLCKRLGSDKKDVEDKLAEKIRDFTALDISKKEIVDQLEQIILKLQSENLRATDHLGEINLKHTQKLTMVNKEINSLKETIDDLKQENEVLNLKIQQQERKIMEIPRLEEQFMRNARTIVRQQEVANTMSKIEHKKMEEENKSLNFWKNKTKSLEEEMYKLRTDLESITNQNRMNYNKYQNLLIAHNRIKSNQNYKSSREKEYSTPSLSSKSMGDQIRKETPKNLRPKSAGGIPISRKSSLDLNDEEPEHTKTFAEVNLEEMTRLRNELKRKEEHIIKLSRKLSLARAFPLLSIDDRKENQESYQKASWEDPNDLNNHNHHKRKGGTGFLLLPTDLEDIDAMHGELESVSSAFMEEERILQEQRNERAIGFQKEYSIHSMKRKNFDAEHIPPHVAAIRKSKSFANFLDDY